MLCGKGDQLVDIVRLILCLVGSLVALDLAALGTAVDDDITLLGVGNAADRLHGGTALVGTVAGVNVYVQGPQANGAVITGGISQGLYLCATVSTDKTVIVFRKAFSIHFSSFCQ